MTKSNSKPSWADRFMWKWVADKEHLPKLLNPIPFGVNTNVKDVV